MISSSCCRLVALILKSTEFNVRINPNLTEIQSLLALKAKESEQQKLHAKLCSFLLLILIHLASTKPFYSRFLDKKG